MNSRKRNNYPSRSFASKLVGAALTGLILTLVGCAISNEGAVTFRKTNQPEREEKKDAVVITPGPKNNTSVIKLPLKHKNFTLSENGTFVGGDSLSVHLRTAYIKDFAEIANPLRVFTRMGLKANGEIAIVANAFEMNTGKELDFADTKSGRLVFYSDDVLKGQFLNFNNMPIYGPIKYNGAPFAFRATIFELDISSEQAKALLGTVAQAGSMAYPPASPVLSLLNGLGQALANSDQDDTEFRYSMVLDPNGGSELVNHFTLEVGNYVLIRSDDRQDRIPWEELELDENEGRVYWKGTEKKGKPYTDNTYLVVEINKNVSSVDIDLSQNSFEVLLTALKSKDKEKAANLTLMAESLSEAVIPRAQTINFNTAKDLLNKIKKEKQRNSIEACFDAEKLLLMIRNLLETSGTLTGNLKEWKKGDKLEEAPKLSESQVEYLLSELRSLAGMSITRKEISGIETIPGSNTARLLNRILPNCNCGNIVTP